MWQRGKLKLVSLYTIQHIVVVITKFSTFRDNVLHDMATVAYWHQVAVTLSCWLSYNTDSKSLECASTDCLTASRRSVFPVGTVVSR